MRWILIFVYFIFIVCLCTKCYCQTYFNVNHLEDKDSSVTSPWGYSIIDLEKDTFKLNVSLISCTLPNNGFAKSVTSNLLNDTSFILFNKIDGTIHSREYNPIRSSFIALNDSMYVLGCVYVHHNLSFSQDTLKSGLIYFNKNGDTLYSRWFGQSVDFIIRGFERIDNSIFLIGVTKVIGDGSKSHLVKTDLLGNLIWENTPTTYTSYGNSPSGICKVLNNGYLVSGIFNYHDVGPVHYGDCGLYRVDTNGNIMWYKKLFNNTNGGCFNIREDNTGNYFLSGNLDTLINITDYKHNGYIAKIDSSANIIWLHVFNEIPHILKNMWQFRILPDGDLIFCGERLEAIGTGIHVGWLCRMDSSGAIKWEHFYKQNDSSDYNCLAEVKLMPDGGFIATGTCRDSLTKKQAVWLIRTDSNGCLVPGCVAPNAIEVFPESRMQIVVYPNPNTGNFVLEYSKPLGFNTALKVIDLTGRTIHTQQIQKGNYKTFVSLRKPPGIYLVQLSGEKGERLYSGKIEVE